MSLRTLIIDECPIPTPIHQDPLSDATFQAAAFSPSVARDVNKNIVKEMMSQKEPGVRPRVSEDSGCNSSGEVVPIQTEYDNQDESSNRTPILKNNR